MLAAPTGGELSARWERDVSVHRWSERVGALTAARSGLCFGRLDHTDEPTSYIGRIGLTDPADGESALVDWRAPAARPFYCATLATPLGVTRRRHFQLAGTAPDERVAAFHDDVLERPRRFRIRVRSGAARRIEGAARVDDARHRHDDPGRAGRDHPAAALRRRGHRGRPGDREDRGRAAPRRLPALHPPRTARPQRRTGRRPQRRIHPLRRRRAPRAGRVGRGVHDPRPVGARRRRDRRRPGRGGRREGRARDAGGPPPRRRRPAGAARIADRDRARRRHRRDRPRHGGGGPDTRPGRPPAAQRRTGDLPRHGRPPPGRPGRRAARAGPGGPARVRRTPRRPPGARRPVPRSCRPSCAASSATTCARTSRSTRRSSSSGRC